jgi:outer membrane biosynthesis protein TonB
MRTAVLFAVVVVSLGTLVGCGSDKTAGEKARAVAEVIASGTGAESIQSHVSLNKRQIKSCYEEQLARDPDLSGKVELAWTVAADGSVDRVDVAENTTGNEDLADCMARRVRRMQFPGGEEPVEVSYPFTFN